MKNHLILPLSRYLQVFSCLHIWSRWYLSGFFLWWSANLFQHAWFGHVVLDYEQYWLLPCYHNIIIRSPWTQNQALSEVFSTIMHALNSASTLDLATINCFFLVHVTKLPPTNVQYLDVDCQSIIEPTQFAFV